MDLYDEGFKFSINNFIISITLEDYTPEWYLLMNWGENSSESLTLSERSFMDGGRITSGTQKGKFSSFVETNLVILNQCQSSMDHKTG